MADGTTGSLTELAPALCKAQAVIKGATKDSKNPHFGHNYAGLGSIWDACREPLTSNGLSVIQMPEYDHETQLVTVETILLHASGQQVRSAISAPAQKDNAQGIGSTITYLRRYSLAAFVGVAPEDDDAESSVDRSKPDKRPNYVNAKGEIILPGAKKKWGGNGGKALSEVSASVLAAAYKWFREHDGDTVLITAMEDELEVRRQAAEGEEETGTEVEEEPEPVSHIPGATKEKQPRPTGVDAGDEEEDPPF